MKFFFAFLTTISIGFSIGVFMTNEYVFYKIKTHFEKYYDVCYYGDEIVHQLNHIKKNENFIPQSRGD